jgi:hypothetical protein
VFQWIYRYDSVSAASLSLNISFLTNPFDLTVSAVSSHLNLYVLTLVLHGNGASQLCSVVEGTRSDLINTGNKRLLHRAMGTGESEERFLYICVMITGWHADHTKSILCPAPFCISLRPAPSGFLPVVLFTLEGGVNGRLCGLVFRVPTNPEVPGSIPGASRFSEKQRLWNGVHSAS